MNGLVRVPDLRELSMNWTRASAIAEILSSIAIVVTIGYLAIEIKQNAPRRLARKFDKRYSPRISNFSRCSSTIRSSVSSGIGKT